MASHATFASKWKWLDWEVEEMQMHFNCPATVSNNGSAWD